MHTHTNVFVDALPIKIMHFDNLHEAVYRSQQHCVFYFPIFIVWMTEKYFHIQQKIPKVQKLMSITNNRERLINTGNTESKFSSQVSTVINNIAWLRNVAGCLTFNIMTPIDVIK